MAPPSEPTAAIGGEIRASASPLLNRIDLAWGALFVAIFSVVAARNYFFGLSEVPAVLIGPLRVPAFGLLAALDVLFTYYLIRRWCLRFDLDWQTLSRGLVWIGFFGLYGSHLVSVALYFPEDLFEPIALLDIRTRISSFGGFFSGAIVAIIFMRKSQLPIRRCSDALVYGMVGGYLFGRLGCFTVHDHLGRETGFFLGVEARGASRHDLGLYEMLFLIPLFALLTLSGRRNRPADGVVLGLTAALYAPARFWMDSMRFYDATYWGMTPGQWFCFPLFALGLYLLGSRRLRSAAFAEA